MAFTKTEGIVIKATNLREADKIVTFFSKEYGKIQGIARGIRKIKSKYSGKLELFNCVHVIFFQKTAASQGSGRRDSHPLLRITQVDVIEVFPQLHRDFNKIIGASYIAEFLNRLFEPYDDTHKNVYTLVGNTFRTLAASENLRNIISAFEIKLLAHLGYTPILDRCAVCGKTPFATETQRHREQKGSESSDLSGGKLGFSSSAGGIVCQHCKLRKQDSISITRQSVEVIKQFLYIEISQVATLSIPKGTYQEIKHLLIDHYQYHTGISLKTEKFVQKLRSANLNV